MTVTNIAKPPPEVPVPPGFVSGFVLTKPPAGVPGPNRKLFIMFAAVDVVLVQENPGDASKGLGPCTELAVVQGSGEGCSRIVLAEPLHEFAPRLIAALEAGRADRAKSAMTGMQSLIEAAERIGRTSATVDDDPS